MRTAELIWVAAISLLSVYEIYALTTGTTTLSRAVWTADRSQYGPFIPFMVGILMGHFFFSGQ